MLESILEYTVHLFAPTPESMPNGDATIYKSTVEGSKQITKFAASASVDAALKSSYAERQTGLESPAGQKGCTLCRHHSDYDNNPRALL